MSAHCLVIRVLFVFSITGFPCMPPRGCKLFLEEGECVLSLCGGHGGPYQTETDSCGTKHSWGQ